MSTAKEHVDGAVKISDEVIAVCAVNAALKTEGVAGLAGGISNTLSKNFLGKELLSKGVKVSQSDGTAQIDVFINVRYHAIIIILAIILLSFDVFTQSRDGRRQIVDRDGGTESELCMILSDIDGVGDVDVMLQYDEDDKITGAIVTAEGAGNPIVKNNLINAVMAVFNISSSSVEVFEKKAVKADEEEYTDEQ